MFHVFFWTGRTLRIPLITAIAVITAAQRPPDPEIVRQLKLMLRTMTLMTRPRPFLIATAARRLSLHRLLRLLHRRRRHSLLHRRLQHHFMFPCLDQIWLFDLVFLLDQQAPLGHRLLAPLSLPHHPNTSTPATSHPFHPHLCMTTPRTPASRGSTFSPRVRAQPRSDRPISSRDHRPRAHPGRDGRDVRDAHENRGRYRRSRTHDIV